MASKPAGGRPRSSSSSANVNVTIIGEFLVDGLICEIMRVHSKAETVVSTKTMIERGKGADANMLASAGAFLLKNERQIPSEFSQLTFVFPEWVNAEEDGDGDGDDDDGFVRALNMYGVTWWCRMCFPATWDWTSDCVLVRFSALALPPGR